MDEIGQTLKVVLGIRRTWFDSRLTWLHVKEDRDMNVLWEKNYLRIWYPNIQFKNIDLSKSHIDRYLTYRVLRDMSIKPIVRNPGTANATNVFKGSEHKIERLQEYTYYWRCVYDLKWYPFDLQTCNMWMASPEYNQRFVKLVAKELEFAGNRDELTEYYVDKVRFCSSSNGTLLVLGVTLSRPLMSSILTIYIPTLLLLMIRCKSCNTKSICIYLSNPSLVAQAFANKFPDLVVQVHLTVLLVLATL